MGKRLPIDSKYRELDRGRQHSVSLTVVQVHAHQCFGSLQPAPATVVQGSRPSLLFTFHFPGEAFTFYFLDLPGGMPLYRIEK